MAGGVFYICRVISSVLGLIAVTDVPEKGEALELSSGV